MYRKTMMVIGTKKNIIEEVSNSPGGAGWMVQKADSGIVWKERDNFITYVCTVQTYEEIRSLHNHWLSEKTEIIESVQTLTV